MTTPVPPTPEPDDDMPQADEIAMDDEPSPELLADLKRRSHHEASE
jgi:hypothetical protein